jgi:hypothetical protein
MSIQDWVKVYEQIATLGFPAVMFLALVGSYFGIWEWGKAVRTRELKQDAREAALDKKWKDELAEVKAAAAQREASQQDLINELFHRVLDGANIIEKAARRVR